MRFSGAWRSGKKQATAGVFEKLPDCLIDTVVGAGDKILQAVRPSRLKLQRDLRRKQHSDLTTLIGFFAVERTIGVFLVQMDYQYIQCGCHR